MEIPESVVSVLGVDASRKVLLWAAVKGYELEELTAGTAAELASLSRAAFLAALGQFGVSVLDTTIEELERDVDVARRAAGR